MRYAVPTVIHAVHPGINRQTGTEMRNSLYCRFPKVTIWNRRSGSPLWSQSQTSGAAGRPLLQFEQTGGVGQGAEDIPDAEGGSFEQLCFDWGDFYGQVIQPEHRADAEQTGGGVYDGRNIKIRYQKSFDPQHWGDQKGGHPTIFGKTVRKETYLIQHILISYTSAPYSASLNLLYM